MSTFYTISVIVTVPLQWNRSCASVCLFIHLMPVFGSIMAVAFLDEVFRTYHAAGIGLILAGIVLAQRVDPRRTPAARPPYR